MKITIDLIDSFDSPEWCYGIGESGEFLELVSNTLWDDPAAQNYHRTCATCGAHVHGDVHVKEVPERPKRLYLRYSLSMSPAEVCPRCKSTDLAAFRDPVFAVMEGIRGRDEDRLYCLLQKVEGKERECPAIVEATPAAAE